jgi:hypothetical protein
MAGQPGFFDLDERYAALSSAGHPLERLAMVVDFELFRAELEAALERSDRAKGGRPPYDPGADVQGPGAADALYALGRLDRIPAEGPALVHALRRPGAGGSGAGSGRLNRARRTRDRSS